MRLTVSILLLVQAAFAGAPVITELQPRGADRSRPFTLVIIGRDIPAGSRISSTLPASFTPVNPPQMETMMTPGRAAAFLVEPKADAPPGVYPIRLESPKGISNVLLFTVGTFPEVMEEESQPYSRPNRNDAIETAEPLSSTPLTVNGTLRGPERDIYRVYGKAGERRVFEVEARRSGSAIDPVLRILDGNAKQLAISDDTPGSGLDARIDFVFPREGNYYVEVHDARFSRQSQNFYRLKMGVYSYADGIFPLGGRRGENTEVTFFGGSLKAPVKTKVDFREANQRLAMVGLPNSPALPVLFAVSDLPELIEPPAGALPIPSVMNARLAKPGQIDRYTFKVTPGEHLLFELQARELGTSRLEGVITVFDAKGKKLDSAGDKPLPEDVFVVQQTSRTSTDPFLNFTVPKDLYEISLTVEDLAERGGPFYGYRLVTQKIAEEFQLSINSPQVNIPAGGTVTVSVNADRRGYDGPIQLSIPDLPKGVTVGGGFIPREYLDNNNQRSFNRRGVLLLTAETDIELPMRELVVWGEGKLADGTVIRRKARGLGTVIDVAGATEQGVVDRQRSLNAPWLGFNLPAAATDRQSAQLTVKQTSIKQMAEGARYEFEYSWKAAPGSTLPRNVGVEIVGAKDLRVIDQSRTGMSGTFAVTTTKATDPSHYDMYITGRVGDELIISRPIPFEVVK
jgi:hypothetical protein